LKRNLELEMDIEELCDFEIVEVENVAH